MPQTEHLDLEEGGNSGPGPLGGHRDQPPSTSIQAIQIHPLRKLQGESDYSDSSWPLYSMYSKIVEEEDDKMVERCQKDSDGTLLFSGLFSATIAALLTVSILDLKPNSQDTSAFYLGNIYQIFGNLNFSTSSIPFTLAKPPTFSPPRYAIWVNSLWFLSLAFSISCATEAMMIRNWAVQYISVTQPQYYTLEKQARIRAIFAKGNPGPNVIWGTSGGPIFLHLSLLLFITGGLIYLFNINRTVFYGVVWLVGYMTISYTGATVAVFSEPHNLLHTPLSPLALRIYLGISYAAFQICSCIPPLHGLRDKISRHYRDLSNNYSKGFLNGKRRAAKEIASKPSSEIDALILERILLTLDEDRALETFFDTIPGFCNSKLSDLPLSFRVERKLRQALDGFLNRTLSSSLISESVRASRLITCLNAAHAALGSYAVSGILENIFNGHWDEALQSVEIGHSLRLWSHSRDYDLNIRRIVACIIARVRRRDDRWTMLVKEAFDIPDRVLRDSLSHGDSVLLSILIHISRETNRDGSWTSGILSSLSNFDILNTLPGLQHDFCTLWNEIVQEARNQGYRGTPFMILREIRHLYIALHQGTDATPTAFFSSTPSLDSTLNQPLSYPQCDITSHRPSPTACVPVINYPFPTQPGNSPYAVPYQSTLCGCTALRLAEVTNTIPPWPSDRRAASEIGESSQAPTATELALPVHTSPLSTDTSPPSAVAAALQEIHSTATLSRPLESGKRHDIVAPCADPHISEILSTGPTPTSTLMPMPVSAPPVLNKPLTSWDAGPAFVTNPLPPAPSVIGFAIPDSRLPSRVPPSQVEFPIALLGSMTSSHPIECDTLPRLRARGLVSTENTSFANAVLQLLVHCPPFWNLFRDLGRPIGRRGLGQVQGVGRGATPLVDANLNFLGEFVYKDELSVTQPQPSAATGEAREYEEGGKELGVVDSFNPRYMYDAMKENRKLKIFLDGQQQDAEEFLSLYLDALNEELATILTSNSTRKPTAPEHELSQSGQTDVGKWGLTTSSAESPISRIFGGRSRSTVRAPNQPETVTFESWRSLQLNIQPDSVHTIQDSLVHISQPQALQVGQSGSVEASRQVHFEALPPVLVLHLKRFLYDATMGGIVKNNKLVQFAPVLEIPLEIMAPIAGKVMEPAHYRLYGVLYHHGNLTGNGHYTVDVLHQNGYSGGEEAWLHIGDEDVSTVRHEEVFGAQEGEDRCASMLLYCRAASTQK